MSARDTADSAVVAPVKSDGQAQYGGERPHEALVVRRQGGERLVGLLRFALAVVAGDLRDHLDLVVGQAGQFGVANDVVGVQVVLAVGDDEADVGQHRAGFQEVAGRPTEGAQLGDRVEQQ